MKQENIRNFAIIAHIDHGKSTLADQIMKQTKTISQREETAQLLDTLSVEKEHGVTVKSQTARNFYLADNGQEYEYNLIDTPGHVDFSYEVSRSLAASDGVILLVDATQGVQAQTIANLRLALKMKLPILSVINKIDSNSANVSETEESIRLLDDQFLEGPILKISAKTGQGIHEVLEAIKEEFPAPQGDPKAPLKALIFDSSYDAFKGVIAHIRIIDGSLKDNTAMKLMSHDQPISNKELGIFIPQMATISTLNMGEVGYLVTGIKDPKLLRAGDTLTTQDRPATEPLPGYEPVHHMVFAGLYPKDEDFHDFQLAIEKLALNDPSFKYQPEVSKALGPGYRCGFLGIFHLQIICERLKKEYQMSVITTAPNVTYQINLKNGENMIVDNPIKFPDFSTILSVKEPYSNVTITTPNSALSDIMKLVNNHLGKLINMDNQGELVTLHYQMPLSKIMYSFFNSLKSISHGYATLETEFGSYEPADVVKIEININYTKVDALSFIVHRQDAGNITQQLVKKLKYTIPRRLYPMPVQAIVEGKSIARTDVPPLRKNAAVNGEKRSVSKKQALLRRQSINKRQAMASDIKLPQDVFDAILDVSSD